MTDEDLLGDGPRDDGATYLPPPAIRHLHWAKDFPARDAVEEVVLHFGRRKQRQMAEVDFTEALGKSLDLELDDADNPSIEEVRRRFPKHAVWFTFDVRLEDLPAPAPVDAFYIELIESQFEGAEAQSSTLEVGMHFGYDAFAILYHFIREPEAIFCECIVKYAEGDGDEVSALARHLKATG